MKRKLALFLAGVMTLTAPLSVSAQVWMGPAAGSTTPVVIAPGGGSPHPTVPQNTVFVEQAVPLFTRDNLGNLSSTAYTIGSPNGQAVALDHPDDTLNWRETARELVIPLPAGAVPGLSFDISLTNAEFYFLHDGVIAPDALATVQQLLSPAPNTTAAAIVAAATPGGIGSPTATTVGRQGFFTNAQVQPAEAVVRSTYNTNLGVFIPRWPFAAPGAAANNAGGALAPWVGSYVRVGAPGTLFDSTTAGVPYILNIQPGPGGQSGARVTIIDTVGGVDDGVFPANSVVRIPLVVRTLGTDVSSVTVNPLGGGIAAATIPFASNVAGGGDVVAIVTNPQTSRSRFPVELLTIREQSVNSIDFSGANGNAIDLVLPGGFYFEQPVGDMGRSVSLNITLARGLAAANPNFSAADYVAFFPYTDGSNRNRIRVWFRGGLNNSNQGSGDILIQGLIVRAEENAAFDLDIMMEIRNTNTLRAQNDPQGLVGGGVGAVVASVPNNIGGTDQGSPQIPANTGFLASDFEWSGIHGTYLLNVNVPPTAQIVTRAWQNVLAGVGTQTQYGGVISNNNNMIPNVLRERVGTRRDWGFTLSAIGDIPELISGRYEGGRPNNYGPQELPYNEHHRTARVLLEENVANSWHGGRTAVLTLPEQVRWRAIEVVNTDGIISQFATPLEQTYHLNNHSTTRTERFVRFDANRLYFVDILADRETITTIGAGPNIIQNERMEVTFDAWVSIAAPFEGDVVLTASGSAIPVDSENLPAAVIATAVPPITIQTLITDTRIGFQYQETADIVITETRTGALLRDREVRITVTDFLAIDTFLSPDTTVELTQANGMQIRNVNAGGQGFLVDSDTGLARPTLGISDNQGTITFEIASESHTGPAQLTLSNVSVRLDRTVPQTNLRPYEVVLWGSAIARNFGLANDQFQIPGISAEYLRVVTVGDGGQGWLAQTVAVTEGESYLTINGVPHSMDLGDGYPATSFISPASESFMVPLRFLSIAFGIRNEQIVWEDSTRTVTITLPDNRIIQFQAESSTMLDNGVPRTITSAHMPPRPVTPEIVGSRLYLPFRFLGEQIFGVEVEWDEATRTAIFNPGAMVSGGTTAE